jgi:hypothetical protein
MSLMGMECWSSLQDVYVSMFCATRRLIIGVISLCFLLAAVWFVCLPKDFDQKIVRGKSKNWTPSVQDTEPQCGFYVIKQYDLKACFSAVPVGQRKKLWHESFFYPSQWWDHRSEKVTELRSSEFT